jgi:hypothetical protein
MFPVGEVSSYNSQRNKDGISRSELFQTSSGCWMEQQRTPVVQLSEGENYSMCSVLHLLCLVQKLGSVLVQKYLF